MLLTFPPRWCRFEAYAYSNFWNYEPLEVPAALASGIPPAPLADMGNYQIRMADTAEDLKLAQALRFHVFNLELKEGLQSSYATGLDCDRFDAVCDHLLVEDLNSSEVVGTYRMQMLDDKTCGVQILPGKRGERIMKKYAKLGKKMPAAAVIGCDPLLFIMGAARVSAFVSEYDLAGAIRYARSRWGALTRYLDDGRLDSSAKQLGTDSMTAEAAARKPIPGDTLGKSAVVENVHFVETRERDGKSHRFQYEGGIVAYDLATGEQKWKWTADGTAYSSPALLTVEGTKMVVAMTAKPISRVPSTAACSGGLPSSSWCR